MNEAQPWSILERFRRQVLEHARIAGISTDPIEVVSARPLTPEEAIWRPERSDFPIQKGKEFMMEPAYRGSRGQAFTWMPGEFQGTIEQALSRELDTDFDRALAVATANAVLRYLNMTEKTVHCRDDGPRECARGIGDILGERFGSAQVGIIGLQPALVAVLKDAFVVRVTDLDAQNVGRSDLGVTVEGVENTKEMIDWADVVLVTGTVLANDTIDGILSTKPTVFYGVTIAGAAVLTGFDRYCPCAE